MHRVEIVVPPPPNIVVRPHSHHYSSGASCCSSVDSSDVSQGAKTNKSRHPFSKTTLEEIVKYRRYLFVVVLCLAYAIAGIFLIVLKSPAPALQETSEEQDQLLFQASNNNSIDDLSTDGSVNDEPEELINRWHVHTASVSHVNGTQTMRHKHSTNGTNIKDCLNANGERQKYGNVGCLFRRASNSDLSGDLCCCAGPVKFKIHHNHTSVRPNNQNSSMHRLDEKKLMVPQILCFVTASSKMFNIHKVVPPIARNSKVTFAVLKSDSCVECSCCQDRSAALVNKLLSGELGNTQDRAKDSKRGNGTGFWPSIRVFLVKSMQYLHNFMDKLYDTAELALHSAKYGHLPNTLGPDHDHDVSLTITEETKVKFQTDSQLAIASGAKRQEMTDYDTYAELDQHNASLLEETATTSTTSSTTTTSTTTTRPSGGGQGRHYKEGQQNYRDNQKVSTGSKKTLVTIVTENMTTKLPDRFRTAGDNSTHTTTASQAQYEMSTQAPKVRPGAIKTKISTGSNSSSAEGSSTAKKSIIISLGDGKSKTIITTIETDSNDNADDNSNDKPSTSSSVSTSTTTTTTPPTTTTTTKRPTVTLRDGPFMVNVSPPHDAKQSTDLIIASGADLLDRPILTADSGGSNKLPEVNKTDNGKDSSMLQESPRINRMMNDTIGPTDTISNLDDSNKYDAGATTTTSLPPTGDLSGSITQNGENDTIATTSARDGVDVVLKVPQLIQQQYNHHDLLTNEQTSNKTLGNNDMTISNITINQPETENVTSWRSFSESTDTTKLNNTELWHKSQVGSINHNHPPTVNLSQAANSQDTISRPISDSVESLSNDQRRRSREFDSSNILASNLTPAIISYHPAETIKLNTTQNDEIPSSDYEQRQNSTAALNELSPTATTTSTTSTSSTTTTTTTTTTLRPSLGSVEHPKDVARQHNDKMINTGSAQKLSTLLRKSSELSTMDRRASNTVGPIIARSQSTTKRSQSIVITLPNDHKQINITTTN